MSEEEFREVFRGSALKRAKWAGLVRNASVALGNSHPQRDTPEYTRVCELLKRLAGSTISTVAESARWALSRIQQEPS
jgi:epoxyqueuosine reductase